MRFRRGRCLQPTLAQNEVKLRTVSVGLAALILLRTVMLALPFSHSAGESVSGLDAIFLSTAATCATGLRTADLS
jgi:hypothetical protein